MHKLRGQKKFSPSLSGKASTVCQMGIILFVLLLNILDRTPAFLLWLYILTFALTVISGFGYGLRGIRSLSRPQP
jgi:phosphatidylglycerophosphate synthase